MSETAPSLTNHELTLPDGRTLSYTVAGASDGWPVVVHHGTPGSRLFGSLLAPTAADLGITLLTPDRPGYGRSSPPPTGWSWTGWRDDVTALLREESIDRAAVVAFSGGGPFAIAAGRADWATRIALVSAVVPPARNGLTRLSKLPGAIRLLFGVAKRVAALRGPESVVGQYTEQSVSETVAQRIAADFHEALNQGGSAVARENRAFVRSIAPEQVTVPIRAWHGTADTNAPLARVEAFLEGTDGELIRTDGDHLGTLLDNERGILSSLQARRHD